MADEGTHKSWRELIVPVVLTAILTVGVKAGQSTYSAVNGIQENQAQIAALQKALSEQSRDLQAFKDRMDKEFVPRVEIDNNRERNRQDREVQNARIDKVETRVDALYERGKR